jgi:hypothetical protein
MVKEISQHNCLSRIQTSSIREMISRDFIIMNTYLTQVHHKYMTAVDPHMSLVVRTCTIITSILLTSLNRALLLIPKL